MKTLVVTAAIAGLLASPVAAAPAPRAESARLLSVASSARAGSPSARSGRLANPRSVFVIALIGAAVVGAVVLLTNKDDDSDSN